MINGLGLKLEDLLNSSREKYYLVRDKENKIQGEVFFTLCNYYYDNRDFDELTDIISRFSYSVGKKCKEEWKKASGEIIINKMICSTKIIAKKSLFYYIFIEYEDIRINIQLLEELYVDFLLYKDKNYERQFVYKKYEEKLSKLINILKSLCDETRIENNLNLMKRCPCCNKYTFIEKDICIACKPEEYSKLNDELEKKKKEYGYIYFCTDGEHIKIGKSKNYPDKRVTTLSTNYHKKFTLLGYVYMGNYSEHESKIHIILKDRRVVGEWFSISLKELTDILTENNYEYKLI